MRSPEEIDRAISLYESLLASGPRPLPDDLLLLDYLARKELALLKWFRGERNEFADTLDDLETAQRLTNAEERHRAN